MLDHVEVHQCNYNWKTFIEVYLEDYHVGPFHPGLGRFVTCDVVEHVVGEIELGPVEQVAQVALRIARALEKQAVAVLEGEARCV